MTIKIAINGFGRIGRLALRAIMERAREDLHVVAINDLGAPAMNAHLFRFDTTHGPFAGKVRSGPDWIDPGCGPIRSLALRDPAQLPWRELEIDVVLECTGLFTDRAKAASHLEAGARRVLISAPGKDADYTLVLGVNEGGLKSDHRVISNASCTTNCLAPVAKTLHEAVGIESGYMTTIHAFTGDQRTLDALHEDPRRARTASGSLIPTSTGAARAIGLVLPELAGRLDGSAIRAPVANVSLIDLVFTALRPTSVEKINESIVKASESPALRNILTTNELALVSADFNHNPASSVFDLTQTQVMGERLVRILSWYDNEWGFANRMGDVAALLGALQDRNPA